MKSSKQLHKKEISDVEDSLKPALTKLNEELGHFVLFHLGFDAKTRVKRISEGATVSLRHARISEISFDLDVHQIEHMAANPEEFEAFLLVHLTRHRRGS